MTLEIGLRMHGFKVTVFSDPLSALSEFKPGLYNLALLDVRMPILGGFKLYEKIEQLDPEIKVCFLTAFEAFKEFRASFPILADKHFLQKPIGINELAKRVNAILNDNIVENKAK